MFCMYALDYSPMYTMKKHAIKSIEYKSCILSKSCVSTSMNMPINNI